MAGHPADFWKSLEDNRIECELCPRHCKLKSGQKGVCFVRENQDGAMILTAYGKTSGIGIDPIEKKPLNHFLPGSKILSFGTAGCNLTCKFCQNWDISKAKHTDILSTEISPREIVSLAIKHDCKSIAYTYNDPTIFLEFARDVSLIAHESNLKTVAVTAGYMNQSSREEFYSFIDGANVDLKSFSDSFYQRLAGARLAPVLDTLEYIKEKTNCWLEITTLLIPGENDSELEIDKMTKWISQNLGNRVPIHFTAFHPDFKMKNINRTPLETLKKAQEIAKANGLKYVYTGNVHDLEGSSSYCYHCKATLIERNWFDINVRDLNFDGQCKKCEKYLDGVFI